jgi:hypothetical protein
MCIRVWFENVKESEYWEYLGVDESIILKLILKGVGGRGLDSVYSGWGQSAGSRRHNNEPSGSIILEKLPDKLRNC